MNEPERMPQKMSDSSVKNILDRYARAMISVGNFTHGEREIDITGILNCNGYSLQAWGEMSKANRDSEVFPILKKYNSEVNGDLIRIGGDAADIKIKRKVFTFEKESNWKETLKYSVDKTQKFIDIVEKNEIGLYDHLDDPIDSLNKLSLVPKLIEAQYLFSKGKIGKDEVDLNMLILLRKIKDSGVKVRVSGKTLPRMIGTEYGLYTMIDNIVNNAVHWSWSKNKKEALVKINKSLTTKNLVIKITDNGPGMSKEQINSHLFGTTTRGEGSGIGWKESQFIAQDHGGDISVESKRGKGTTFIIKLPKPESSDKK